MGLRTAVQTREVLRVLLERSQAEHYGLEISKAAGLAPGVLYPILAQLERDGWLESDWEKIDEHVVKRRRRRYYSLTPDGLTGAQRTLAVPLDRLPPQMARPLSPGWAVEL
jgi:PadR family transcriptional regulator PadR